MNLDNAKEKILQAALNLLDSEGDAGEITTRQIAKKANVNLALINYYYQSKENLMVMAAGYRMGGIIEQVLKESNTDEDPVVKLKKLLTTTADFSFKHHEIFKIAITGELKEGCKTSCAMVIPLLKELFGNKSEAELRIIALQLMLPFHFIVLYPDKYGDYLDVDFFNDQQRTRMIIRMTENLLSRAEGKKS
ncbi:MAG TPA: TetR family transcriptional regulator [Bacillota bacterium]|nr:TetR family transcriptional regulator [Bacillota bacterium]